MYFILGDLQAKNNINMVISLYFIVSFAVKPIVVIIPATATNH